MDDRELALIAVFRLHEVADRLGVLARVAGSTKLKALLQELSQKLAEQERSLSEVAETLPLREAAARIWPANSDLASQLRRDVGRLRSQS